MPLKKIDSRIRTLIDNSVTSRHRCLFVLVGDHGRDQVSECVRVQSHGVRPTYLLYVAITVGGDTAPHDVQGCGEGQALCPVVLQERVGLQQVRLDWLL